jgi:DNA-binding MarR family transcriptional regulator
MSEGMSVNELAARTLTHQSSVSVVVKRLVDQGLLIKRASEVDSRSRELTLSKKGKAKLSKAPVLVQERLLEALSDFGDADREHLARLLGRFVAKAGLSEGVPPLLFEDETPPRKKP